MGIILKVKNRKIIKVGTGYCFLIPMAYIKNGLVDTKALYTLILEKED
jgi:hypothetical protein